MNVVLETYHRDEGVLSYDKVLGVGTVLANTSAVEDGRPAFQPKGAVVNREDGIELALLHGVSVDLGSQSVKCSEHVPREHINRNLTGVPQAS